MTGSALSTNEMSQVEFGESVPESQRSSNLWYEIIMGTQQSIL